MQTRNFAEEFQSCRRRSHGDFGENLCLCCSRDSLGAYGIPPNLKCGRGGRQRIPRDERPKPPLLCERDRKFESISLQRRVSLSPASAFIGREPRLSARVCTATVSRAESSRTGRIALLTSALGMVWSGGAPLPKGSLGMRLPTGTHEAPL